jgi:hypothetical protein
MRCAVFRGCLVLLLSLVVRSVGLAGTEITYRGYVKEMKAEGIDAKRIPDRLEPGSVERLIAVIQSRVRDLEKDAERGDKERGKTLLLNTVLERLETARTAEPAEQRAAYVAGVRGLYSVEAEAFENAHSWRNRLRMLAKVPGRFCTKAPRATADLLDRHPKHATESQGLVDEQGHRLTLEQLEAKTVREIADLDVAADHPTWLQEAERRRTAETAWERMERRVEQLASQSRKHDYRLETARRVLFLERIKQTATAPKLDAEDLFGFGWKVKFGNQTQPEVITSRLFVLLGQKFVDLVYANPRGGMALVLLLPKVEPDGEPCVAPSSTERLTRCLRDGHYHFDLTPYVDKTGVIQEVRGLQLIGSAGDELASLPDGAEARAADLVGRTYVTFRESEVEFQGGGDVVHRVGPVAKNFAGANEDRGERAGLIANMWVNNFDAKDENSKAVVLAGATGSPEILEIYHDLGGTLGDQRGGYGRLNKLKSGEKFLHIGKRQVRFKQFMLYRPTAWKRMTAADGLWMARRVASITRAQIEGVVAPSHLPAFVQQVYVYKIMDRRDRIAEAYGLTVPDRAVAPQVDLDLSPAHRSAVAHELGLDPELLDQEIARAEQEGFKGTVDHVVVDGRISDCQDSIVLGLLESEVYPSGLTRRTKAFKDDHPLPRCRYGVKPARY